MTTATLTRRAGMLVTIGEACAVTGLSPGLLLGRLAREGVTPVRVRGRLYLHRGDLEALRRPRLRLSTAEAE